MSGFSETVDCPRCGSEESFERSVDRDDVSGLCMECGYSYQTVYAMANLEDINEERAEVGYEPLTELKPAVEGWTDEH